MAELDGRVALVTGSTSGIGEATLRRLHALGASVVVNSSSSVEAGEALVAELGDRAAYVQADISEADEARALVTATVERFGALDVLVNNAGWTTQVPHGDLDALTDDIMRRTFDVNVLGTWWVTSAAMPHLHEAEDGNIVTITSIAGLRSVGSSIAYSMSKAALNHMTRLLARSHGPIRANAVAPGLVATPWTSGDDWTPLYEMVEDNAPLGRTASPDDIAEAVLGCIRMRYLTGEVIAVDGGLTQVV